MHNMHMRMPCGTLHVLWAGEIEAHLEKVAGDMKWTVQSS